jgi:phage regulator Rha-like protein
MPSRSFSFETLVSARCACPNAPRQPLAGDRLVTDSLRVAHHFGKQHKNVLLSLDRLDCSEKFNRLNFSRLSTSTRRVRAGASSR